MTKKNDGGAAFPRANDDAIFPATDMQGRDISSGMSLRDWFAGQAISGLIGRLEGKADRLEEVGHVVSVAAYVIADAMLAERDK